MSRRKRKRQAREHKTRNAHKNEHHQRQAALAVEASWRRYQKAILAHDLLCLLQVKVRIDDMCHARLYVLCDIWQDKRDAAMAVITDYYMKSEGYTRAAA